MICKARHVSKYFAKKDSMVTLIWKIVSETKVSFYYASRLCEGPKGTPVPHIQVEEARFLQSISRPYPSTLGDTALTFKVVDGHQLAEIYIIYIYIFFNIISRVTEILNNSRKASISKYYLGIKQEQNIPMLEVRIKFIKRREVQGKDWREGKGNH